MATKKRLALILALLISVTVLSWYLATGGGRHPVTANLAISALVLFIALLKARVILREFMEVRLAPTWVRRSSDCWLAAMFAALFVVHVAMTAR